MPKKYHVKLEASERSQLEEILRKGKSAAHAQRHARILLLADENRPDGGLNDQAIAQALEVGTATVERVRRILVEHGLDRALERKDPDRYYAREIDANLEAHLVAIACESPPQGRSCWTMQLLADRLVELELVESLSDEGVRLALKKTKLNLGRKNSGA